MVHKKSGTHPYLCTREDSLSDEPKSQEELEACVRDVIKIILQDV